MEDIRIIDVKKALRLLGWELVHVEGYISFYRHPDVPGFLSIYGRGYDVVSPRVLSLVERQLGLGIRSVLCC